MPDGVQFVVDIRRFNGALRKLDRELQKETRRRIAKITRRERDRIRADWPAVGPARGGHSRNTVTAGTQGLVPYISFQRANPRYLYAPWLLFGGRRRRHYSTGVRVDRRPRVAPPDGYAFYPGIKRARKEAINEVFEALQDAKRRAGLR